MKTVISMTGIFSVQDVLDKLGEFAEVHEIYRCVDTLDMLQVVATFAAHTDRLDETLDSVGLHELQVFVYSSAALLSGTFKKELDEDAAKLIIQQVQELALQCIQFYKSFE